MFHNDRDGIRLGIERGKEPFIGALLHRALSELLVIAEEANGIFQVGRGEMVWHAGILRLPTRRRKMVFSDGERLMPDGGAVGHNDHGDDNTTFNFAA